MKTLFAKFSLIAFILIGFGTIPETQAQGVKIDLQLFDLKLDSVNALFIRPVGEPFRDSTGAAKVRVYYELRRKSGKVAESGNWDLPKEIYAYVYNYVLGTVVPDTIDTINEFFQAAGLPELVAIMPEEQN